MRCSCASGARCASASAVDCFTALTPLRSMYTTWLRVRGALSLPWMRVMVLCTQSWEARRGGGEGGGEGGGVEEGGGSRRQHTTFRQSQRL
jgi:hypothetical protein